MPALVVLAAVAVGVFADGGYSATARVAFGVAALLAAATVLVRERAVDRSPLLLVLVVLAALGALSALWTLGPPERTLRWALVTLGYAALVAAAAAAARRPHGVATLAGGLAGIAVVAGAIGLVAVAGHDRPYALRIAGVWRPGGPFEYPPALALLELSALPALLAGMLQRARVIAVPAAAGMAIAAGVIALSASRVSLALAVAVAGAALARERERRRQVAGRSPASGRPILVVAAIAVAAALAGSLAFGTAAGRGAGPAAGFLHGRSDTWRAAVETFADHPLYGAGADAFLAGSIRHQGGQTVVFAHDLPLELAAELGIAGLLLALALYAATGAALWRARGSPAAWLLGPAAAAFLVASLVDWPWHLAGSGAIWAMAAGGLCGQGKKVPSCRR
jgi:O-antigen ligase